MTDGIIQEVIRNMVRHKKDYDVVLFPKQVEFIYKIEQELIEKIKQKAKENSGTDKIGESWIECPLEELIGDNQE